MYLKTQKLKFGLILEIIEEIEISMPFWNYFDDISIEEFIFDTTYNFSSFFVDILGVQSAFIFWS